MQAMRLADDVCVVRQGRIVYRAPKEEALAELNIVDAHLGIGAADAEAEPVGEMPAG
jgi:ABC-type branched-subunit amino acid transport system ATPase component